MACDDEDDYMSNVFVEEAKAHASSISTLKHISRKRKIEAKQHDIFNQKNKMLPKRIVEVETRNKALATALTPDNPGFKLLAKMGYKSGEGLGKHGKGRVEPVPISVKIGRTGLGKDTAVKEKKEKQKKLFEVRNQQREKMGKIQRDDFRSRMRDKFTEKKTQADLYKCQKVCYQLDSDSNITEPNCKYFWPQTLFQDDDDDEEEEEEDVDEVSCNLEEQLLNVTEHLRTKYLYCIWCAHKYHDIKELNTECPGNSSSLHDDE